MRIGKRYLLEYANSYHILSDLQVYKQGMSTSEQADSWSIQFRIMPEIVASFHAPGVDGFDIMHLDISVRERDGTYQSIGGITSPNILIVDDRITIDSRPGFWKDAI